MKNQIKELKKVLRYLVLLTILLVIIYLGFTGMYYVIKRDVLVVVIFIVSVIFLGVGYTTLKDLVRKLY